MGLELFALDATFSIISQTHADKLLIIYSNYYFYVNLLVLGELG